MNLWEQRKEVAKQYPRSTGGYQPTPTTPTPPTNPDGSTPPPTTPPTTPTTPTTQPPTTPTTQPTTQPPTTPYNRGTYLPTGTTVGASTPLATQQQRATQQQMNTVAHNNMLAAGNRFGEMMTGEPMAAQAARQREAQARAEANQRAAAGHQINQAGFGGTPLGAAAGRGVETQIRQDRFDNVMGIEAARQDMMTQGAQAATAHAGEVNRFEAERMMVDHTAYELAGEKFSEFLSTHPGLVDAVRAAGGNPAFLQAIIQNDPGLRQQLAELHQREGGDGNFDVAWAANKINNWHNSADATQKQIRLLEQLGLPREDAELFAQKEYLELLGYAYNSETNQFERAGNVK